MLNGHMDPGVEMTGWTVDPYEGYMKDGWIWGMGAHDDKGNVAAMIIAVEAIVASGLRPKGDILLCPVIAHKYGGLGTRALLKAGVTADMCINLEHAANTIANVCVGVIMARIRQQRRIYFSVTRITREPHTGIRSSSKRRYCGGSVRA
ncbi:MAG TPA: M20/M25/M40 family metallo-hydrolase [Xanthobacteraceae bacterium]|nr:M20/M25/M40 family metallo-hydrolase [Xanthobacteraceae bacterium]